MRRASPYRDVLKRFISVHLETIFGTILESGDRILFEF
jgi:hypothetical protein